MLYYDFSTGLEVAKPSSNSSSLTISSTTNKAVRGNSCLPSSFGGWRGHLDPCVFFGRVELQEVLWLKPRTGHLLLLSVMYLIAPGWQIIFLLCLQIQIFLLKMNNKKRILVRLERLTIFMVEQENSLENAVSYYLGGVPPAALPPR